MSEQWPDEQKIISYLLGVLSEIEAERLDELSLSDDAFAARFGVVENDLVDAYVRGELSGDTLERFNRHYLASPLRREKVNFAQTFAPFADAAATNSTESDSRATLATPESKKKLATSSPWLTVFKPRFAVQWGLAALALLLLLASGYFLFENVRLKNQMTQTQAERASLQQREQELQRQLDEQHTASDETAKELADVRARLAQLEALQTNPQNPQSPQNGNTEPSGHDAKVVAFTLAPPLRGAGPIAQITLPAGTDQVDLQLQLDANDFPAYQAVLKNPATAQVILRSPKLKASGKQPAVRVNIPAHLLNRQNYVVELSGIPASGDAEIIGSYPFNVILP